MAWLCTHPHARFHSFDIVRYDLTRAAIRFLSAAFGARFAGEERVPPAKPTPRLHCWSATDASVTVAVTAGPSESTLPLAVGEGSLRCDVSSIDGGHDESTARRDLTSTRQLARGRPALVTMDNVRAFVRPRLDTVQPASLTGAATYLGALHARVVRGADERVAGGGGCGGGARAGLPSVGLLRGMVLGRDAVIQSRQRCAPLDLHPSLVLF